MRSDKNIFPTGWMKYVIIIVFVLNITIIPLALSLSGNLGSVLMKYEQLNKSQKHLEFRPMFSELLPRQNYLDDEINQMINRSSESIRYYLDSDIVGQAVSMIGIMIPGIFYFFYRRNRKQAFVMALPLGGHAPPNQVLRF
jgi:hypothetical protein